MRRKSKETCINPYIKSLGQHYARNGSLSGVTEIKNRFQRVGNAILPEFNTLIHDLAFSDGILYLVAIYELLRYKKVPLPDLDITLMRVKPLKDKIRSIIL